MIGRVWTGRGLLRLVKPEGGPSIGTTEQDQQGDFIGSPEAPEGFVYVRCDTVRWALWVPCNACMYVQYPGIP